MSNDLMRFSVAMPEELLVRFDQLVARRGLAKNRSEVVRDLVRDALVEDECSTPGMEVVGTLTAKRVSCRTSRTSSWARRA